MNPRPILALAVAGLLNASVFGDSNIDNTVPNKHAWSENVGWTNWRAEATAGQGVLVTPSILAGFVWSENIGWINFGDGTPDAPPYYANANGTDFGVNIAGNGDLHGFAWAENAGWINFDGGAAAVPPQPARIEPSNPAGQPTARLIGYAWAENAGWVTLADLTPGKFVAFVPDNDQDGIGDAADNCPGQSNLGQTDIDGDGVGDTCDGCATDAAKVTPGVCGCGKPDVDADGNGTADCNETPVPPNPAAGPGPHEQVMASADACGTCGAGTAAALPFLMAGMIASRFGVTRTLRRSR